MIASAAVAPDHPQLLAAERRGIEVLRYAEALGRVQAEHTGISIAGTHGKSTTTAMLCHTLIECGLDPSFIVGATCAQIGGGARVGAATMPSGHYAGRPGLLVAEACEFNRSFHHHRPTLALINNVEEDHLDIYGSIDRIVEAFRDFARLLPDERDGGRLLIAHDGAHRREITAGLTCAVDTFGYAPSADYQVVTDAGVRRVGLLQNGIWLTQWTNALPGEHNALNSAAAAILAAQLGADWEAIGAALTSFRGIDRRLQRLGSRTVHGGGDVVVYDDYGHHPTEIDKTLRALRAAEQPQRLICVFQPHQHSRTRFLLEEFAQSFSSADVVIVPHIYFVRDSEIEKHRVSARDLVDRLRSRGQIAMHLYPFEAISEQLEVICRDGDLVVIMGAGPVWQVGRDFLAAGAPEPLAVTEPPAAADLAEYPDDRDHHRRRAESRNVTSPATHGSRSSLFGDLDVDVTIDAPLGARTWYGIGGTADVLVQPRSVDALETLMRRCHRSGVPVRVLGSGANLLVADDGIDGIVVRLDHPTFRDVRYNDDGAPERMRAFAGADLSRTVMDTARRGLAGLDVLAGIPASIGGALRMNAGGAFGAIGDTVDRVVCVTRTGERVTYPASELRFDYRTSNIPDPVIIAAVFRLEPTDPIALRDPREGDLRVQEEHAAARGVVGGLRVSEPDRPGERRTSECRAADRRDGSQGARGRRRLGQRTPRELRGGGTRNPQSRRHRSAGYHPGARLRPDRHRAGARDRGLGAHDE